MAIFMPYGNSVVLAGELQITSQSAANMNVGTSRREIARNASIRERYLAEEFFPRVDDE